LDGVSFENWDEEKGLTFVACEDDEPCQDCKGLASHEDCIVIAVDGACKDNGTAKARMAIGVFFGEGSVYNKSIRLKGDTITNQVAELQAAIVALQQVDEIHNTKSVTGGMQLYQVVMKADSEYMVDGITNWVPKLWTWSDKDKCYWTQKGNKVANSGLFRGLDLLVQKLNCAGVEVLFWHVPRGLNTAADKLANSVLKAPRTGTPY